MRSICLILSVAVFQLARTISAIFSHCYFFSGFGLFTHFQITLLISGWAWRFSINLKENWEFQSLMTYYSKVI